MSACVKGIYIFVMVGWVTNNVFVKTITLFMWDLVGMGKQYFENKYCLILLDCELWVGQNLNNKMFSFKLFLNKWFSNFGLVGLRSKGK